MQLYEVGDAVIHWIYGSGKIVAIGDKGVTGNPRISYVIEGSNTTLWVPVEENGRSSLHLPISRSDFELIINLLRSQGEEMPDNPYQRHDQLEERMYKASPRDLCLVVRDLAFRGNVSRRKLSSSDVRFLNRAQSLLAVEWERSMGTSRDKARREMEWILKGKRFPSSST